MDIRATIIREMKRQNRSQSEVARLAGMARPGFNRYLHGTQDLTGETLGRLFAALGLRLATDKRRKT